MPFIAPAPIFAEEEEDEGEEENAAKEGLSKPQEDKAIDSGGRRRRLRRFIDPKEDRPGISLIPQHADTIARWRRRRRPSELSSCTDTFYGQDCSGSLNRNSVLKFKREDCNNSSMHSTHDFGSNLKLREV